MSTTDKNSDVSTDDIYAMLAGEILPSDIHRRRAARKLQREWGRKQTEFEKEFAGHSTPYLIEQWRREQHEEGYRLERRGDYEYESVKRGGNRWDRPPNEIPLDADDAYFRYRTRQFAFKKVIDTRPHVPNKIEGVSKRQQAAASRGHGPKKKGGRRIRHAGGGESVYHGR